MVRKLKKWTLLWLPVVLIAIIAILNDCRIKNKEKELYEIAENCYNIDGVKYLSYTQLKYIALNELSHDEVQRVLSIFGLTKKPSSSESTADYKGDCGNISLQILDRSNSEEFIRYTYDLHTNNKEYIRLLKSEIKKENDNIEDETSSRGIINDYWCVGFNTSDRYCPTIYFQRFQSKKLPSRTKNDKW